MDHSPQVTLDGMDIDLPDLLTVAAAGLVAGLAIALPLGAIGVLIVRRGVTHGFRAAGAAGSGVAFVDTVYCVLAVAFGAAVAPVIVGWGAWPRIVGGAVLLVLGLLSLVRAVRPPADATPANSARPDSVRRGFRDFVLLTAINPMTLLYFAGVAAALGTALADPVSAAVFVLATGVASLAWQLVLAAIGARLGRGLGAGGVRALSIAGAGIVLGLGAVAVLTALPEV